jgi:hypothetical protein
MNKTRFILLSAALALATALTLSCSGDDGGDLQSTASSSGGNESSSSNTQGGDKITKASPRVAENAIFMSLMLILYLHFFV